MKNVRRFLLLLAGSAALYTNGFSAAETYKVDSVHSSVIYKIRHMGVTNHYGRFDDIDGTVVLDEGAPESGSINLEIKSDSFDSKNPKRDEHVKGPDFLNTKQFPTITFKSTAMKKTGDKTFDLTGDLNFHGVTKPVTAKLEMIGKGKGPKGNEIAGAEATFTIKRSDYGMNFMMQGLGDDVSVIVAIEAGKQAAAAPAAQ